MTAPILTQRIRWQLAKARALGDHIAVLNLEARLCAICDRRQPGRCLCRRVTPRLTTHRASRAAAGERCQRQPGASVGPLPRD